MTAEFETINGRYWDPQSVRAWWYDPSCCSGWAYGYSYVWFGHWSNGAGPSITYLDDSCRLSGQQCVLIRSEFRQRYTLTWFWCFSDEARHPVVEHFHKDYYNGRYTTEYRYSDLCAGLSVFSSHWLSGNSQQEQAGP